MKKVLILILTIAIFHANSFEKAFSDSNTPHATLKINLEVQEQIISDYFIDKDGFGEIISFYTMHKKTRYICSLKISQDNYNCKLLN